MTPQPLNYLPNNDPNRRVRVLVFVLLWVVWCGMLAVPGYAMWRANAELTLRWGWPAAMASNWGNRSKDSGVFVAIVLVQFLTWGWFWFRLREARKLNSGRATSTFTSLLGICWFVSSCTSVLFFEICRSTGVWGWPAVWGVMSAGLIVAHIPRMSKLWPQRAE